MAKSDHDYDELTWAESADISTFLNEIDDDAFDAQSLCEGWRVRDVIGHMITGHTTPALPMLGAVVRYRGNIPRGSLEMSRAYGSDHSPTDIRATWAEVVAGRIRKGIARVVPATEAFADHLIHHQDMRRPLGLPRQIPEERLVAALDAMVDIGGMLKSKKRMSGLRWTATDLQRSWGEGPELSGPAESLIMAASGRPVALAELGGEGVAHLAHRIDS